MIGLMITGVTLWSVGVLWHYHKNKDYIEE